eukprot:GHRQ01025151.1.p2 GENE.GHRQ01025151.1~~GHRQ01025151.1.p2  ORF type:complete len:107 (-),score=3.31 GHRQ01025151.1:348-668(-)
MHQLMHCSIGSPTIRDLSNKSLEAPPAVACAIATCVSVQHCCTIATTARCLLCTLRHCKVPQTPYPMYNPLNTAGAAARRLEMLHLQENPNLSEGSGLSSTADSSR